MDQHRFALWAQRWIVAQVDDRERFRVGRHQANEDRRADLLGEVEGLLRHAVDLVGRRRLEHRQIGHHGKSARILFGHARAHAGIVGHVDHETAHDARIGDRDQRVVAHVEARHLHRAQRALTRQCRAARHFEGDLLVDAPLYVDTRRIHLEQAGERSGRRRPGVARHHLHSSLQRAICQGFATSHELRSQTAPPSKPSPR